MLTTGFALVGAVAMTAVSTAPAAMADEGPTGSAYALSVETTLLDKPLIKIDPRPTAAYPKGASESLVKVGPNLAGLVTANVLNASANLDGRTLTSAASIADIKVGNILTAKVVTSECTSDGTTATGKSSIAELTVLGKKIDVSLTGDIDVLGAASVRLNEQVREGNTLTVNAVHVRIGGLVKGVTSADIVLSQAKCSVLGSGGPSTPTSTATSTTTTTTATATQTSSSAPSEPASSTTTSPIASGNSTTAAGVDTVADDSDLAETGVSGVLPISIAGLLLVGAGVGAVLFTRRRRAAAASNDSAES